MKPEFIVGRPVLNSVSMHLHVEVLISMEVVLKENDGRNSPRYVHCTVCPNRTSVCFGKPFLLLEKKPFQSVEGLPYFLHRLRVHAMQINKMLQYVHFLLIS